MIQPTLGFQSMKTAYATLKGFEVMRIFKKGQFTPWIDAICGGTEARFINRLFGLMGLHNDQACSDRLAYGLSSR